MKTPEDEAFDDIERKQREWGGGFPAKRKMTMDKLQEFCTCHETHPMECQGCRANRLAQPEQDGKCKLCVDGCIACDARAQPAQEPVAHPVIAGALYDFMGWLTSRKERIVLSSADNASPAADAIRDFANMRGLSLDDAKVLDWNTAPPQRPWVSLTDAEIDKTYWRREPFRRPTQFEFARDIEQLLKGRNNG